MPGWRSETGASTAGRPTGQRPSIRRDPPARDPVVTACGARRSAARAGRSEGMLVPAGFRSAGGCSCVRPRMPPGERFWQLYAALGFGPAHYTRYLFVCTLWRTVGIPCPPSDHSVCSFLCEVRKSLVSTRAVLARSQCAEISLMGAPRSTPFELAALRHARLRPGSPRSVSPRVHFALDRK